MRVSTNATVEAGLAAETRRARAASKRGSAGALASVSATCPASPCGSEATAFGRTSSSGRAKTRSRLSVAVLLVLALLAGRAEAGRAAVGKKPLGQTTPGRTSGGRAASGRTGAEVEASPASRTRVWTRARGTSHTLVLPAHAGWVDTGLDVRAGEPLLVEAEGRAVVCRVDRPLFAERVEVGPEGTYLVDDHVAAQTFPLPAGDAGPAPCFALIGRIGDDGPPLLIGRRRCWKPDRSGRLFLSLNDFDYTDNSGRFVVRVSAVSALRPAGYATRLKYRVASGGQGRPRPGSSVVVFYVDGLRPDVLLEMADQGHLPNIRRVFLDGGAWLANAFTAFPSDTITSNGTMWTGCFSDRHGLKGQVRFSRRRLVSESYLDPLGPSRSARVLSPQGADRLVVQSQAWARRLAQGDQAARQWLATQTSGVRPLYAVLAEHGLDWATTTLPVMTEMPPVLWTRSLSRFSPPLSVHRSWQFMDEANTRYAVRELLARNAAVTVIWLPETDSASHKRNRGQFGAARRVIARADELIGLVVDELQRQGRLEHTYLILVSDHGHHGGRTGYLSRFDLANDLFFQPRQRDRQGRWVGGGLGLSVRQHRVWNRHPEDGPRQFVFLDAQADGAARIFLPRGWYGSRDWSGPNRPGDLLRYRVAADLPPVNLVELLTHWQAQRADGRLDYPVDLVLLKLDEQSVLVATRDRGYAVIQRRWHDGRWLYRYTPVENVRPTPDGRVEYDVPATPRRDPLRLLQRFRLATLRQFLPERVWLEGTAETEYPQAVVTLTRALLWQSNLREREREYAPDLVVTAASGWYFGDAASPGTAHGHPFADTARVTWFVSGPNVLPGVRVDRPCNLVDLTPTILDMLGVDVDGLGFDGRPVRDIYQPAESPVGALTLQARFDDEVRPNAAAPLQYHPTPDSPLKPWTVNHPRSPWDLHSVVYNVLSLSELTVFHWADLLLFPYLPPERGPVTAGVERLDAAARRQGPPWLADLVRALNVPDTTLSDYNWTSLTNLKRIDATLDWLQARGRELERPAAQTLLGRERLPGTESVEAAVDAGQYAFWETYRLVQRVVARLVDEQVLAGIENQVDRSVNRWRAVPSDVLAEPPLVTDPAPVASDGAPVVGDQSPVASDPTPLVTDPTTPVRPTKTTPAPSTTPARPASGSSVQ